MEPLPGVVVSPEVPLGTAEEAIWMLRLSELMMPSVTVFERPSGAPIAMAFWPTLRLLESPNSIGWRPLASVSLMTARSTTGSVPTTLAV